MSESVIWESEGRVVFSTPDGVLIFDQHDPAGIVFTAEEWTQIVEATEPVWETEHPSITQMRAQMEAKRDRGEAIPGEIAQFLETHPPKRSTSHA